jgi:hypothetical protein
MLVEVGFQSEKEQKWKRESGAVEGGRVWVAFIELGPRRDVEARRWFGTQLRWALQCIGYGSGGEDREEGKQRGGPLPEGEEEEARSSQR